VTGLPRWPRLGASLPGVADEDDFRERARREGADLERLVVAAEEAGDGAEALRLRRELAQLFVIARLPHPPEGMGLLFALDDWLRVEGPALPAASLDALIGHLRPSSPSKRRKT
jgi:hypothetical protein